MTREEKALLYEDLVREGDRVNREVSKLKSIVDRNPQQQAELEKHYEKLAQLESRLNSLFAND